MFFYLVSAHEKERRFCLNWDKMIFEIIRTGYFQILIQKNIVFRPFQEEKKSFFGQFRGWGCVGRDVCVCVWVGGDYSFLRCNLEKGKNYMSYFELWKNDC